MARRQTIRGPNLSYSWQARLAGSAMTMDRSMRLAAIVVADVVGYSRLMEVDETGTLAALTQRRKGIVEPVVRGHSGRIVKFMGDGVLIEFASAVNAVEAALELQSKMEKANEDVPENHRIDLRVGVNLGDVIGDGSDIYGDGVNIAARLEALAEPGAICVSAKVRDEVRGKVEAIFEDLGECQLKNITEPIRTFIVRYRAIVEMARPSLALPSKPSIAVLPFQNMSADPERSISRTGWWKRSSRPSRAFRVYL